MKRFVTFFLITAILLSFAACGSNTNTDSASDRQTTPAHGQSSSSAHTNSGVWKLYYYVDQFNEPTNDYYIKNASAFVGTFSNSATTDSRLEAHVIFDAKYTSIMLYEYGNYLVKNSSSKFKMYTIVTRDSDGYERELRGLMNAGYDRMVVIQKDAAEYSDYIAQTLKSGKDIRFYIYDPDRKVENYSFKITPSNFTEIAP